MATLSPESAWSERLAQTVPVAASFPLSTKPCWFPGFHLLSSS